MRGQDAGVLLNARGNVLRQIWCGVGSRFDKHCQCLVVVARGHESDRDRASGANTRQAFQSRLEFLGGVVGAAHDDDVLLPSAYIELAIVYEPAVTGVQPAVLQRPIGEVGAARNSRP